MKKIYFWTQINKDKTKSDSFYLPLIQLLQTKEIMKLKKAALSLALVSGVLFSASAQIYINTGNPNVQKAKQNDPKAPVVNLDKSVSPTPVLVTEPVKKVAAVAAQTLPNDLPPSNEPGKCYARIAIPAKYETVEERVIDKPASYRTEIIPATYKTVKDSILSKPAGVRKVNIPATTETVTEDILVTPATQKWVKVTDPACMLPNPADCQILQLKDIPAVYKTVSRQVTVPATVKDIPVPAEYKVVSRRVVDLPEEVRKIEIPATYKVVTRERLVSEAGYSEWQEVLCGKDFTPERIKAIQEALIREGFSTAPADGVIGARTKAALINYQKAYNLPIGNLNLVTLKHLKVY